MKFCETLCDFVIEISRNFIEISCSFKLFEISEHYRRGYLFEVKYWLGRYFALKISPPWLTIVLVKDLTDDSTSRG